MSNIQDIYDEINKTGKHICIGNKLFVATLAASLVQKGVDLKEAAKTKRQSLKSLEEFNNNIVKCN